MIIHITGPAGSGKSYVQQKLSSDGFRIIDLDELDDKIALELLKRDKYHQAIIKGNINVFFKKKTDIGHKKIEEYINQYEKEKLIFIGLPYGEAKHFIPQKYLSNVKKYAIWIEAELNYKRLYLRTLEDIHRNYSKLQDLVKNEHPEIAKAYAVHKYKLRADFIGPFFPTIDERQHFYEDLKNDGYIITNADNIVTSISELS